MTSTCVHVGVPAGHPWAAPTREDRCAHCSLCGVPWPGYQMPKPARTLERASAQADQGNGGSRVMFGAAS